MIRVHHLDNSRSHRVLWLLEELGLAYEIVEYKRGPDMLAPKELRDIHPLGKSPVITDGDRKVAESGAILEYLVDTYGDGKGLRPTPGTEAYLSYRYWMHYAEGSLMPQLLLKLIFTVLPKRSPFIIRPIINALSAKVNKDLIGPNLSKHAAFVEATLSENAWFAGNSFSAADIQMSFPVEALLSRAGELQEMPGVASFVERIHARPAYKRAIEKGGPLDIMG